MYLYLLLCLCVASKAQLTAAGEAYVGAEVVARIGAPEARDDHLADRVARVDVLLHVSEVLAEGRLIEEPGREERPLEGKLAFEKKGSPVSNYLRSCTLHLLISIPVPVAELEAHRTKYRLGQVGRVGSVRRGEVVDEVGRQVVVVHLIRRQRVRTVERRGALVALLLCEERVR